MNLLSGRISSPKKGHSALSWSKRSLVEPDFDIFGPQLPIGRVRPGNPKMAGPKLKTFLINVLSIFHKNISMQKCHLHAKKIENVSKILGKITKTAIKFSIQLDTF